MTNLTDGFERLQQQVLSGKLDRRAVLKRAAVLGLSAPVIAGLLAACGGDDATNTPAPAAANTAAPATGATEAAPAATEAAPAATEAVPGATEPVSAATQPPAAESTTAPDAPRGGGGHLRLLYWQAPVILNTHLANGTKDYHAARVCLEPLADLDNDTEGVLQLASEWPSLENGLLAEDGMSVTWKLREGVKWHDGEDFDADDVIFTYEYIVNEANAATTSGPFQTVDRIERDNDHQITIHFKEPNPAWKLIFIGSGGVIIPEHVFKDYQGEESRNAPPNLMPIGTGPFRVTDFRPGDVVQYEMFEDYWDPGKPYLDSCEMKGGGDAPGAARAVCQSGEADWAWNLQIEPAVLNEIESGGLGFVLATPGQGTERVHIQFADPRTEVNGAFAEPSTKHPIWSDLRARQALRKLIQRDVINDQLYGKGGQAATNMYDIPAQFTDPDLTWEYDPEGAKALLDEMGFTGADILFQTSLNSVRQKTQEIMKQAMEPLGFRVEIKAVDAAVYFSTDQGSPDTSGKFWADLEMHTNASGVYPATWFQRYRTDEICQQSNGWARSNPNRYSNPEFDALHDQCRIEMDPAKQQELFRAMMKLVTETDVAEVPVVNRTQLAAVANRIENYTESAWSAQPVYDLKNVKLKS